MTPIRLHSWDDLRLILACAEKGSFAAAAASLQMDQVTVSRRIRDLEQAAGRPLFTRKRSGASPTAAGLLVLEQARAVARAVAEAEHILADLTHTATPTVTIAASEGLLRYTLIPVLLGDISGGPQPMDVGQIRAELPPLAFSTQLETADVAVMFSSAEDAPALRGAYQIRRVGTMHLVPAVGDKLLASGKAFDNFDQLVNEPLLDIALYRSIRSLDDWNGLVHERLGRQEIILTQTTPTMHQALVKGVGVGVLPPYSTFYDDRIVLLDINAPRLASAIWLVAHEDKLREPAVRLVYDTLAKLFLTSPWYREHMPILPRR